MSDKQVSSGGNVRMVRLEYQFKSDPVPERKFELIVTTRSAAKNTRIPFAEQPTIDELAIMVARTMTNWKNVMQAIIFNQSLPDNKLAAIRAIRNDEANEPNLWGIPESDFDPYVTVWNMVNYYNPGLTITIHSYDDGSEALAIARAHIAGITLFETHCEKLGFIVLNKTIAQGESPTQQTTPPQNQQRIGQHADSLPDTGAIADSSGLRPAMYAPAGSQGEVMFASGKNDTAWQFAQWATKKIDYQNKSGIQYGNGEIRAYPLKSVEIKEVKGSKDFPAAIVASIKTQLGNIDIWKKKKDSDENTYDWIALSDAMAQIGILSPQLVVGFKKSIDAIVLIKIAHSEDGTKEYKNLYGFRAMPTGTQPATGQAADRPHDDLNTYFGTPDETNEYTRQDGIPY